MVLTNRAIGHVDPLDPLNGVLEVIWATQPHMIISNEGHIHLTIHSIHLHMEAIRNKWVQEVGSVLVGSKDRPLACRDMGTVVVMITMVDKKVIYQIPQDLLHILLQFLYMLLAHLQMLQWGRHNHNQITIMDSHRVQIMGTQRLTLSQHILNKAMVMGTMIMLLSSIPMGVHSHIHTVALLQVMVSHHSTANHHMACHPRVHLPNLMALPGLVSLVMCLIKLQLQPNHMVRVCHLNSHIHMLLVHRPSRHILHMGLLLLLMAITSHHLHLVRAIHSKEASRLQVTASLVSSKLRAMHKWLLPQGMGNTLLRSKVIPSSLLQTLQVMGIKRIKILDTGLLCLLQVTVQHQLRRQVMLHNLHKLSKVMISQSNSLVLMVFNQVLQLVMGKRCHLSLRPSLSLVMLSMIQPRCMLHLINHGLVRICLYLVLGWFMKF